MNEAPAGGRLPLRGRWTGRSPGRVWRGHLKVEAWLNWMVKSPNSRRGRCPHRPETWRAEPAGINVLPSHRTSGTMRASSPTRWENFAIHQAPFFTCRCPLHTRRCGGTLSKQERAGDSLRQKGRYQVGSASRPTPVRASPCHPLPGEGFSPHPARAQPGPPSPEGKAASGGGGRYPRSGSPAALRQRTRREPSFTAIRAGFSVK